MQRITLLLLTVLVMAGISAFTMLHPGGENFKTGSPYDGGLDCSACHSGGATTPTVTITAVPDFTNNTYAPGTTYTISVNCSGSYPKYGFGLEILNSNTTVAADAGTFGTVVTTNCKKVTTSGKPTNITHNAPTGTSNAAVFSFNWTAPASGTVYIYCACNGVNNNGTTSGDKPKKTSLTLQSATGIASLEQNWFDINIFPNPSRDYATLEYTLEENANVKIELYDVSGKKAGEHVTPKQLSGEHRETINLSEMNLKSGVYSVLIKAGDKVGTKRLVVN